MKVMKKVVALTTLVYLTCLPCAFANSGAPEDMEAFDQNAAINQLDLTKIAVKPQTGPDDLLASMRQELGAAKKAPAPAPEAPVEEQKIDITIVAAPNTDQAATKTYIAKGNETPKVETKGNKAAEKKIEDPAADALKAKSEIKLLQEKLSAAQGENDALQDNLNKAEGKVVDLSQQLKDSRNRLMIAETEVERLSTLISAKNQSALASYNTKPAANARADAPAARA